MTYMQQAAAIVARSLAMAVVACTDGKPDSMTQTPPPRRLTPPPGHRAGGRPQGARGREQRLWGADTFALADAAGSLAGIPGVVLLAHGVAQLADSDTHFVGFEDFGLDAGPGDDTVQLADLLAAVRFRVDDADSGRRFGGKYRRRPNCWCDRRAGLLTCCTGQWRRDESWAGVAL